MIYKTLLSTLVLSVAFTGMAFAQDKSATKPTKPQSEDAQPKKADGGLFALGGLVGGAGLAGLAAPSGSGGDGAAQDATVMGSGSTAGKASFQDLSVASDSRDGLDRIEENLSIAAPSDGFVPVAGAALGVEGGGGGGKVDVQDISFAKSPKLGDIMGESQDKADSSAYIKFDGVDGESIDKDSASDLASPACVTESGAPDADCNGVPDAAMIDDRNIRKRPEPRQQRR